MLLRERAPQSRRLSDEHGTISTHTNYCIANADDYEYTVFSGCSVMSTLISITVLTAPCQCTVLYTVHPLHFHPDVDAHSQSSPVHCSIVE